MFSIGCESLSQSALEKLGKGSTVDDTLELTRLILKRGGSVVLGIMDHYVFSDRQMVNEYLESLEKLKGIVKKYPKHRVKFTNNGVTHWPTREAISEFTDDFTAAKYDNQYERYLANIPEESETFKCNKDISLALVNSGINQFGATFVSLL